MTAQAIDVTETVRLWKDPDARWELDREALVPHPAGEITLKRAGFVDGEGALRMLGVVGNRSLTTFAVPSVSGPCLGLGPLAGLRS